MKTVDFKDIAYDYQSYGLCAIPLKKGEKRPGLNNWKQYQQRQLEPEEINKFDWSGGIGLVTGKVSGQLEVLDFDNNGNVTAKEVLHKFLDLVYDHDEKLVAKLPIERSPSGGYHLFYRASNIEQNLKLAQDIDREVLIETRGEGGFIVVAPSTGYEIWNGLHFDEIPTLLPSERDLLIKIARTFDQIPIEIERVKQVQQQKESTDFSWSGLTPFDAYNAKDDVLDVLSNHGFSFPFRKAGAIHVKRSGTKKTHSGYFFTDKRILYLFSPATVFEQEKGYNPTSVYIELECKGDAKEAFKKLYAAGYGDRQTEFRNTSNQTISEAQKANPKKFDKAAIPVKKEYFEKQHEFKQKLAKAEKLKTEEEQKTKLSKALSEITKGKFNFDDIPVAADPIFFVKDVDGRRQKVAALGQMVVFVGKQKSRKTTASRAVVTSALSAFDESCINFILNIPKGQNILSIDTEQDRTSWHFGERRMLKQAGLTKASSNYHSYNLRPYSKKTRLQLIDHLVKNTPNLACIIIDGAVDICENFNDVKASEETVDHLMNWCSGDGRNALLFTVLHLNKGEFGALRGHLGTALQNKANVIIEIQKDIQNPSHSSVICRDIRGKPFDKYEFTQNAESYPVLEFHEQVEDPTKKKINQDNSSMNSVRQDDNDIPF